MKYAATFFAAWLLGIVTWYAIERYDVKRFLVCEPPETTTQLVGGRTYPTKSDGLDYLRRPHHSRVLWIGCFGVRQDGLVGEVPLNPGDKAYGGWGFYVGGKSMYLVHPFNKDGVGSHWSDGDRILKCFHTHQEASHYSDSLFMGKR